MPERKGKEVSIWDKKFPRRAFVKTAPVAITMTPDAISALCFFVGKTLWDRFLPLTNPRTLGFQSVDIQAAMANPQTFKTTLDQLDTQIANHSESTLFSLNQSLVLACRLFEMEMGIASETFNSPFSLEERALYFKRMGETQGCINPNTSSLNRGYVYPLEDIAHIDLDFILYKDPGKRIRRPNPATFVLAEAIHELHHLRPPLKRLTVPESFTAPNSNTQIKASIQKGLVSYAESPRDSLPGKTCLIGYRNQVEEAVAQDSTARILAKIGIMMADMGDYDTYVQIYRQRIINPLYAGNHRPLLELQQATKKGEFFSSIGQRLNAPKGKEEIAGESFVSGLMVAR